MRCAFAWVSSEDLEKNFCKKLRQTMPTRAPSMEFGGQRFIGRSTLLQALMRSGQDSERETRINDRSHQ
jgi:hypothetical protein